MTQDEFIDAGKRLYGSYGWQTELAEKLIMSKGTINRYANGKARIPGWVKAAMDGLEAKR